MTSFKSAYEKGQNWISNRVDKFKYEKIKPMIFSRGAMTYSNNNKEFDNYEQIYVNRSRVHSIDVGELGRGKFDGEISKFIEILI